MLELLTLAVSVIFFLASALVGDALRQRRRRLHREAVAWAVWANDYRKQAEAYAARINGMAR